MGLGLFGGGKGVTEFLCQHGARVTVTDKRSAEVLEPMLAALSHLPLRWVLGEHKEEDFTGADLVIANPAVPRDANLLRLCQERGIPLETEMNLFFKHCAGRICAITGSNGKTTTTSLVGAMATRRWPGTRIGGNLGKSLLPEVASIRPDEWVILELSSFQLEDMAPLERRPEISVITNLSPNHLDRHQTYERYLDAKREILGRGSHPNVAVLNAEDAMARSWSRLRPSTFFFGRTARALPRHDGAWIDSERGEVLLASRGEVSTLFPVRELSLAGRFNLMNAAGAGAAAAAMGVDPSQIREAVRDFRAVEHRLEPVREHEGISYLNDSIATTPESTIAALEALGPNIVLICGGSSKGCSFHALGQVISRKARGVVLLGQTAEALHASIPRQPRGPEVRRATGLEDAVLKARAMASPGYRVILSPACPSYDMFVNFVERGRRFKEIVLRLSNRASSGPMPLDAAKLVSPSKT